MKKVNIYSVNFAGKSELVFTFGYDPEKRKVVVLFKKSSANPRSLLENYFTGKNGMFSAKDGKIFIEQLPEAMSHNSRIWAKIA